jgi:hypothetical protein
MKFVKKNSIAKFWFVSGMVNKGHGSKQYFYSKKSKSLMRLELWPSSLWFLRYNQKSIFLILIPSIIKWNWLLCDSVVFFYWKTFHHDISSVPILDYTYPNPFTPMFTINDVGGRRTWTSHLRHTNLKSWPLQRQLIRLTNLFARAKWFPVIYICRIEGFHA